MSILSESLNPDNRIAVGDLINAIEKAIIHIHATRRSEAYGDTYPNIWDRYSFTNKADAREIETALQILEEAIHEE